MKKIFVYCLLLVIVILAVLGISKFLRKRQSSHLTHVTLAEVAHSIFYAPQYLADALGYFEDEGLDVDISLSNGADNVMAAVLSGDADIGFCGTEATILVVYQKRKID